MLRVQRENQYPCTCRSDFFLNVVFIVSEVVAQVTADVQCLLMILNDFCPAENDNAFDIQRPLIIFPIATVIDAEGNFVAVPDGVNFMSRAAAVKIQFSVGFTVIMVNRQTVGIAVVADDRENASFLGFQNLNAFFGCERLFFSCHISEHESRPFGK